MRLAGPPPTSPSRVCPSAKGSWLGVAPAPYETHSEQGCEHSPGRREQSWCHTPKSGKGALGFTPIQMFFGLTKHFNKSLLKIFLHRQCCLQ